MKNPIFILGIHKSGTTLLRSLLDNHHNLFVLPIESHVFKHNGISILYPLRNFRGDILTSKQIITNYLTNLKYSKNLPKNFKGGDHKIDWNISIIQKYLEKKITNKLVDSIKAFYSSLYYDLFNSELNEEKRVVEKSVEHLEFAIIIKNLFPTAKFIHISRNYYSNLVSIRKFMSVKKFPYLLKPLQCIAYDIHFKNLNKKILGDDYHLVDYEYLLKNPKIEMKQIADFLDLMYESTLENPTTMGKIWRGNSTNNIKYQGVSAKNINRWKKNITPLEIGLINKYFYKYVKTIDSSLNSMRKIKNEKYSTFIKNRLLLKTNLFEI